VKEGISYLLACTLLYVEHDKKRYSSRTLTRSQFYLYLWPVYPENSL